MIGTIISTIIAILISIGMFIFIGISYKKGTLNSIKTIIFSLLASVICIAAIISLIKGT